jgi:transcriptional antiterminator RfaH
MHWYLVFTKPRQEVVAKDNLERQGYRCYLPQWRVEKKTRGRQSASMLEPLFPRYLFIELDTGLTAPSWAPIRFTVGVTSLVRFGTQPAKAPPGLIDTLHEMEAQHARRAEEPFSRGDPVLIREGPFAGLQAVFQQQDADQRAIVLLEVMSRSVKIKLQTGALAKSGASSAVSGRSNASNHGPTR